MIATSVREIAARNEVEGAATLLVLNVPISAMCCSSFTSTSTSSVIVKVAVVNDPRVSCSVVTVVVLSDLKLEEEVAVATALVGVPAELDWDIPMRVFFLVDLVLMRRNGPRFLDRRTAPGRDSVESVLHDATAPSIKSETRSHTRGSWEATRAAAHGVSGSRVNHFARLCWVAVANHHFHLA